MQQNIVEVVAMIKCNVGRTEQKIRIGVGLAIIAWGAYYGSLWGLIGVVPIITGAIRYCPASAVLGVSTCEEDRKVD